MKMLTITLIKWMNTQNIKPGLSSPEFNVINV